MLFDIQYLLRPKTGALSAQFASMPSRELLSYFQNRSHVHYFSLASGKPDHVIAAEKILNNQFDLNNEVHQLSNPLDWQSNPSRDIEWLILLHKFYYVKDLAGAYDFSGEEVFAGKWVSLISTWIAQTPVGFIDSQVTGRRLQQWLLGYHYFVPKCRSKSISPDFILAFIESIHAQTHYLCRHLTPEGNHRTIELYAIFLVAVIFPELEDSGWFLEFAKHELLKNLQQDFLSDGVHRELSTDYHHIVLKNFLRIQALASLNNVELPEEFGPIIEKAIRFSSYVHKPDGFIPAINDGDSNSYLSLLKKAHQYYPNQELLFVINKGKQGTPPKQRSRAFTKSGYVVLRSDWGQQPYAEGCYLFFDCAPLGFGSHGHYDLLSFEMSAYGHALIVDPGRYTYSENNADGINWRRVFKGTAYHNTVVIDKKDQAPYRCGSPEKPEPQTILKKFVSSAGYDFVHGQALSHEYDVSHERMIFFAAQEYWIIQDNLQGDGVIHQFDMYLHLSANANNKITLEKTGGCATIHAPHLIIAQSREQQIETVIESGFVSPEYGIKEAAPVVKFSQTTSKPAYFQTVLYPYRDRRPNLQIGPLPIFQSGRLSDPSVASAITIRVDWNGKINKDIFFIATAPQRMGFEFSDVNFHGQVLFLRRDDSGQIKSLQGIGVHYLVIGETVFLQDLDGSVNVSFYNSHFELKHTNGNKQIAIENCRALPTWLDINSEWS